MAHEVNPRVAVHMRWDDLAFVHWRADAAQIAALLPPSLEVEEFDGSAWIGLVPFTMRNTRFAGAGRIPTASDFLECNVRTYVRARAMHGLHGSTERGVWFFSLDAQSLLAVLGARIFWHLPYLWSRMRVSKFGPTEEACDARREYVVHRRGGGVSGKICWTRHERSPPTAEDSLDAFLTDRDRLFTFDGRRTFVGVVHHLPWQLHRATLQHVDSELISSRNVTPLGEPIVCATEGVDTQGEPLRALFAPIVFFDGDCGFCHRAVQRIQRIDSKGALRFAPLMGETYSTIAAPFRSPVRGLQLDARGLPEATTAASLVLLDEEGAWARSDAVIRILRECGGLARIASYLLRLIPMALRDYVYDAIASRRRRGSPIETCDLRDSQGRSDGPRMLK